MANDNNNNNKGKDGSKKPITKDERFKSVHNDPRFRMPNFKNLKVKVDDRFSKEELNKLNVGALGKKVKIDRYGRKISNKSNDLDKFYEHEDDKEEEESEDDDDEEENDDLEALTAKIQKEEKEQDEEESSDDEDDEDNEEEPAFDRARGEGLMSSSEDEDSSSSDSDSDSDDEEIDDEAEDSEIEIEEGKPDESDPTSSFAVVNMDWDNIRAVDLMATFISFVPKGGSIKSVTIYPSEFGKERIQKEEIEGPPRELFKSKKSKKSKKGGDDDSDSDSDDIDSDIDANDTENLAKIARKLYEEDDGNEDYDSKALRRYQLQRLRYFYAVVCCDSVQTSKLIYDNCDGTEYESTANIFDLRYIPEDMEFDQDEAKDTCTKIPSSYRPDSTFVTDALQHSKVKLTWDETPKERLTLSSRPLSQKEIEENDFKAYLASDSDESEAEDGSSIKEKYQSLLGQTFTKFGKEATEDDVDMEITFDPGLNDKQNGDEEEKEKEETTIEAYRRKEKERRQKRLAKFKESKQVDDNNDKESTAAKSSKSSKSNKKKQPGQEMDEKSKAELELVLMDNQDSNTKDHFNMKDVIKAEKQKKNKKGKKKKNIDEEMVQDDFVANLNDPRFSEIFESHDYAIDPTNSEFKKTETMKKILEERANRNKGKKANNKVQNNNNNHKSSKRKATNEQDVDSKANVRSLAQKLKKKQKRN